MSMTDYLVNDLATTMSTRWWHTAHACRCDQCALRAYTNIWRSIDPDMLPQQRRVVARAFWAASTVDEEGEQR